MCVPGIGCRWLCPAQSGAKYCFQLYRDICTPKLITAAALLLSGVLSSCGQHATLTYEAHHSVDSLKPPVICVFLHAVLTTSWALLSSPAAQTAACSCSTLSSRTASLHALLPQLLQHSPATTTLTASRSAHFTELTASRSAAAASKQQSRQGPLCTAWLRPLWPLPRSTSS